MKKFEYSILTVSSKFSDINKMSLRDVGEQGWEVSGVIPESLEDKLYSSESYLIVLKKILRLNHLSMKMYLDYWAFYQNYLKNICASQERREAAVKAAYYFLLLLSEENVTLKNMFISYMAIVKYDADPYLKTNKEITMITLFIFLRKCFWDFNS